MGETNLETLLGTMRPILAKDIFAFCTIPKDKVTADILKVCTGMFIEQEGTTLILEQSIALSKGLTFSGEFACITLTVHSSLEAVGLTAAVSSCLADIGISANVVAAYYHDHVFVPYEKAALAVEALNALSQQHQ
ncbi:ACT domain-containing protein [Fluctibacter corallii]|nr:ACT domain-containing protein [Aestuariibacter sp. AA17]